MNILIYVPTIVIDRGGGDSIHVRELVENLSKLGNKVVVICGLASDDYNAPATINRVRSPSIKVLGWFWANIYGLYLGLVAAMSSKCDLVYTRAGVSASAWFISRLAKVPCVTEVNGLISDEAKISGVEWWRKALWYFLDWIEGKAYKRSEHLIAVAPGIKKALVVDFGIESHKITVIPNGANVELLKPMDTNQAREELNLSGSDYLVTFVGHLAAWHGIEHLIKSIPYVIREGSKTKFLIVGDGLVKEKLIELARQLGVSGNISFTGMVQYDKVPLYINASDVCVAPMKKDILGSPLKLYEYMACGKPVVATRASSFDVLEKSGAGVLVNPENSAEFANTLVKLLQESELRKQMGENGRRYVVENRSWESVARRVAEVCEKTLQEHERERNKKKL